MNNEDRPKLVLPGDAMKGALREIGASVGFAASQPSSTTPNNRGVSEPPPQRSLIGVGRIVGDEAPIIVSRAARRRKLEVSIPEYLFPQIKELAASREETISTYIMRLLRADGHEIADIDMIDLRKR